MRNQHDVRDWPPEERPGRRRRPRRHPVLRWLLKIVSTALIISLTILFLPQLSRLLYRLLPDTTGSAASVSTLLRHRFEESARLETAQITDEGLLTTTQNALFFGQVLNEELRYTYQASFGVDLRQAEVSVSGRAVIVTLPGVELLLDSLTPERVSRENFWNPLASQGFGDRVKAEQERCRARYLQDPAEMEKLRESALKAMEKTVTEWLGPVEGVSIQYQWAAEPSPAPEET